MNNEVLIADAPKIFGADYRSDMNERIASLVSPSDWVKSEEGESWVELGYGQPGDLEPEPCVVFCNLSYEPGCIASRTYRYL